MARRALICHPPHGRSLPSQLRHHRPHRPRKVDIERPSAGAHRVSDGAGDAGADPGRHGPGARAGHHHQGARGAHDVQGERRQHLPAEPDRYAGTCGLQLRGFALAGLVRGRAAGGGREPGRGSADTGQCLSGDQPRPRDHSGDQQDRSALGGYPAHTGGDRAGGGAGCDGRDSVQREDRAGRGGDSRSHCAPTAGSMRTAA